MVLDPFPWLRCAIGDELVNGDHGIVPPRLERRLADAVCADRGRYADPPRCATERRARDAAFAVVRIMLMHWQPRGMVVFANSSGAPGRQLAQMIHRCLTDPTVEDVDILGSLRVRRIAAPSALCVGVA